MATVTAWAMVARLAAIRSVATASWRSGLMAVGGSTGGTPRSAPLRAALPESGLGLVMTASYRLRMRTGGASPARPHHPAPDDNPQRPSGGTGRGGGRAGPAGRERGGGGRERGPKGGLGGGR